MGHAVGTASVNTLASKLHGIQPQNAGGGAESLGPPSEATSNGSKEQSSPGSVLWGIYHERGADEVNKGSFYSHHPRNLAKMKYFLGKACTEQKKHTSFSDTKGNTVQAWGEGGE